LYYNCGWFIFQFQIFFDFLICTWKYYEES
jgi:hypothetical protein